VQGRALSAFLRVQAVLVLPVRIATRALPVPPMLLSLSDPANTGRVRTMSGEGGTRGRSPCQAPHAAHKSKYSQDTHPGNNLGLHRY
jgi:hypothetical protein